MGSNPGPRAVARVIRARDLPRRRGPVLVWRNPLRSVSRAHQPGCPLRFERPRVYTHFSFGSPLETFLRFAVRNIGDRTIHSYFCRHVSPAPNANGGFGSEPDGGLVAGASQHHSAHLTWPGAQRLTVDFVQFADGSTWLSDDPKSSIARPGLDTGAREAGAHLLRILRAQGTDAVRRALPNLHMDLQNVTDRRDQAERHAVFGVYTGLTHAKVRVGLATADTIEAVLERLVSEGSM
jgi:hypothetical protein